MADLTPEELAAWREDAHDPKTGIDARTLELKRRILALLDALAETKRERDKYLAAYSEMFDQRDEYAAECKRLWPIEEQVADAERRGAVAALREAADEVWGSDDTDDPDWAYVSNGDINLWLRNRADRIEGDLRGNDGLTDEERRGFLTSFHKGIGAKHVHSHVRAELEKVRAERDALLKEKRQALPTGPDEPYRTPEGVDEIPREW